MIERTREQSFGADVAVVVVNYATPELTMRAVAALAGEREALPQLRAVVVDGGSPDRSADFLRVQLEEDQYRGWATFMPLSLNGGFAWANNQAVLKLARQDRPPEFIHFLNPDTEVVKGSVVALVNEIRDNPKCAAVGSQLLNPDGTAAASAFRFPSAGREFVSGAQSESLGRLFGIPATVITSSQSKEVDWVTGASFLVRANALQECGLFDDGFFLYFEEVELMHRFHSHGWSIRHVPESRVVHLEGAATGLAPENAQRPLPPYWYQSRRRYFGLTGGRAAVLASGAAALMGMSVATLKQLALRKIKASGFRFRDFMDGGFFPTAATMRPSVPKWGDMPGRPPAWMVP